MAAGGPNLRCKGSRAGRDSRRRPATVHRPRTSELELVRLAPWMAERFGVQAFSVKHLGYRDAEDAEIFLAAREVGAVVMTF